MRALAATFSLLLTLACTPIQTVALSKDRIPPGSQITVHVIGFDGVGLEHVISEALMNSGFDVRSSAAVSLVVNRSGEGEGGESVDLLRRYQTPYVCRMKVFGRGKYIDTFSLQLIHVESGRLLLSMRGAEGTYTTDEVAKKLREQFKP